MTTLLLLLFTLAALCAYRWHLAARDADYWRKRSEASESDRVRARIEIDLLYRDAIRCVDRREALVKMVRKVGEN